ncbi:WhiB family transcriptional regulator [Kytococcus sedentarius]|uniref:WhiB family transcriptional regulator n=1 Tax=Kytococcus sedentarius TaxID=1276 RepID=UPI0035BC8D09
MLALADHQTLIDQARVAGQGLPCLENDPDTWFADTPAGVEHAKSLCHGCPVRTLCLEGAVERREPWGVWGGELIEAGRVLPRKRPRGRPRKHPIAA